MEPQTTTGSRGRTATRESRTTTWGRRASRATGRSQTTVERRRGKDEERRGVADGFGAVEREEERDE